MTKRLITSFIGLIVFFAVLFAGLVPFTCAVVLAVIGMIKELYSTIKSVRLLNVAGYISALILLSAMIFGGVSLELGTFLIIAIYLFIMIILHSELSFKDVCTHGFLTFFITFFFGTMIRLYSSFGMYAVLLVFVCAWMTDTGAYFIGCSIGKHKLIPSVSPKKTVEGAIGGIVTCIVSCLVYLFILNRVSILRFEDAFGYAAMSLLALGGSIFSQLGDLVASCIKRDCEAKDFGNLLPGHGGILDRFDSVIYITPFIYYLLSLIQL